MVTWLTRSLTFIVAGAVLAYAVTVHNDRIDLQTTGVILLLVGIFDLLLNFALSMYLRQPVRRAEVSRLSRLDTPRPYASERTSSGPRPVMGSRPAAEPRAAAEPRPTARYRPIEPYPPREPMPPSREQRPVADDDGYPTRPIPRDNPDWH